VHQSAQINVPSVARFFISDLGKEGDFPYMRCPRWPCRCVVEKDVGYCAILRGGTQVPPLMFFWQLFSGRLKTQVGYSGLCVLVYIEHDSNNFQKEGLLMAATSKGNCYVCGVELGKVAMKNHILKAHTAESGGQKCRLLKIEGAYYKEYWLYIDLPMERSLYEVDSFLRWIWLECCGHMSAFRTPRRTEYSEIDMSAKLSAFSAGDKILHEYDFGTTTTSLITIMECIERPPQREIVRLLARNVAPTYQCKECNAPAEYICTYCIYDSDNPFLCTLCGNNHDHDERLLPVANSPRMGECGYDGEQDPFTFDLEKIKRGDTD